MRLLSISHMFHFLKKKKWGFHSHTASEEKSCEKEEVPFCSLFYFLNIFKSKKGERKLKFVSMNANWSVNCTHNEQWGNYQNLNWNEYAMWCALKKIFYGFLSNLMKLLVIHSFLIAWLLNYIILLLLCSCRYGRLNS